MLHNPSTSIKEIQTNLPRSNAVKRLEGLDDSAWQVHIDAMARKRAGESIIALSIGDPDFSTPGYIVKSVVESLNAERTHYTHPSGENGLRSGLAEWYTPRSIARLSRENFSIYTGATSAIFATALAIADPGDNIVTCQPTYLGYDPTFECLGVSLKTVATEPPRFRFDTTRVIDNVDDQTVAVLVNSPSNPMGNIVPVEEMQYLYEECCKRKIWLISDEVYSQLYFEKEHVSIASIVPDYDNVVVIDSLSKSHAMSGWRLGWALTNPDFTKTLRDVALAVSFSGCPFIQDAGRTALLSSNSEIEEMRLEYQHRRDYTIQRISNIDGITAEVPEAGMFVMVNVYQNSDVFARRLLDESGVSVVPGTPSGEVVGNYIRVGLTQPISVLEEAWDRIESWLN